MSFLDFLKPKFKGCKVTIADQGEAHSRLYIQFLDGAIHNIHTALWTATGARKAELLSQLEEKLRHRNAHAVLHPSDANDAEHMKEHVKGAREK